MRATAVLCRTAGAVLALALLGGVGATAASAAGVSGASGSSMTPASSVVGGKITTSEIRDRMENWYDRKIPYSQSNYVWDLGHTREYRTDCSGFADMALHLSHDYNTSSLATAPSFVKRFTVNSGNHSWIKPSTVQTGDVFDDTIDGHAFVFAGWNSNGTFNYYNFGGGSSGVAPPEHHTGAHVGDSSWGYENANNYVIYRLDRVVVG